RGSPQRGPPLRRLQPGPGDERTHLRAVRNRQFFDRYWSSGRHERDALWREWWRNGYEQILAWGGPLAGKRVLNLFAGLGEDAAMLTALGAEVVALDFSLPGLRQARRLAADPPLRAVCADATALPIATASID